MLSVWWYSNHLVVNFLDVKFYVIVLGSYCYYNRLLQIKWLKSAQMYSLTVLRSEVWNGSQWTKIHVNRTSLLLESRTACFLASSSSESPSTFSSCGSSLPQSQQHIASSSLCLCLPLANLRTLWLYWAHLHNPGSLPHLKVSWPFPFALWPTLPGSRD